MSEANTPERAKERQQQQGAKSKRTLDAKAPKQADDAQTFTGPEPVTKRPPDPNRKCKPGSDSEGPQMDRAGTTEKTPGERE